MNPSQRYPGGVEIIVEDFGSPKAKIVPINADGTEDHSCPFCKGELVSYFHCPNRFPIQYEVIKIACSSCNYVLYDKKELEKKYGI